MTQFLERPRERHWSTVRFVLGMAQMAGTTVSVVLLFRTGISTLSLLAVVVTCAMTTLSVLLFGSKRQQDA